MRLKFTTPLSDQTVKEGNTARFELELSHENVPITWYKNEIKLHPSRMVLTHVEGKKHILEIKDITLDDICQIKAEAKGISTTANVMVLGNPLLFCTFCSVLFLYLYVTHYLSVSVCISCYSFQRVFY